MQLSDDRSFSNISIDNKATFKGNVENLLRIWILEESRIEDYEYDGNSNRKKIVTNRIDYSYQYYKNMNGDNTERVMYDGKWWYTYDDNGNRTARATNAVQNYNSVNIDETKEYWLYTWDLWNRLVKVEQHNAPDNNKNILIEYTYDVLDHRIKRENKTEASVETTKYAYGRNGALTYQKKIDEAGETSRTFAFLNNQIVGFIDKGAAETRSIFYTTTDIQGSVTEVYDEAKNLVWKSGYTAFGIKAGESTKLIEFDGLYTGCDYDAETGLSYHWHRWRCEDGSSWLSQDIVRDGLNWYGYASQNPVMYTAPDGKFNVAIDSTYKMNTMNGSTYLHNFKISGTDIPFYTKGCAITAIANLASTLGLSFNPSQLNNETYVNSAGNVEWNNVAPEFDLNVTVSNTPFTYEMYDEQENDTANNYYTIIRVQYDNNPDQNHHWVGVTGKETVDGVDYFVISPTSVNDSNVSPNSIRGIQGWKKNSNDEILVPVDKVKAYRSYSAPVEE